MQQAQKNTRGITEGVIWKQLLLFFFPILLGTFFQQLYNTVDAIIVGKFVGKEALAAVGGTTGTLINLLVGFFVGLSSGATVIISQYYGARRDREVGLAVHTSIALAIAGGAIFMVIGIFGSPLALRLMDTPEDVLPYASTYIRIYFVGMIPSMIYNIGSGILRAVGDSRRPLYFLIICCLTNLVLDLLFVVVFKLGVTGAAIATVLSQVVSAILVLLVLVRTKEAYHMEWKEIRFTRHILINIIQIGFPAGLQSAMYNLSNILIQSSVNHFGTDVIAAWAANGKIDAIFWMVMGAFGVSVTTFVGQNFGAQQYARIRKSVRVCMVMAFLAAAGMSALMLLAGKPILSIFSDDPAVIAQGEAVIRTLAPLYFTYVCVEILSGAVRGTGDSLLPTLITCLGICVLRIVWVYAALPVWNTMETIVLSYPISWAVTSLLYIFYYLHGGWLRRRIAHNGFAPEERVRRKRRRTT
ncbi:MATE family efflux transporter [Yeguia hominis]|uniref:MATE family efflux transporter n=1 Tax=Yeguia hominis TaxID=2763662 RepID=A0A926D973_9FIRM|nr:MATE family efflux transporter [Yeguia hominis]MBC8533561.1 MATE family efflux transporter [Yeguia hominis]